MSSESARGAGFRRISTRSARAKIGIDTMSVVDPQLTVHGISKLRVADVSVMPSIV